MTKRNDGLIVNISSFGGLKYLFNVCYGAWKMVADLGTFGGFMLEFSMFLY